MSQNLSYGFDQPLRVELQPSRLLLQAGLALYLLAAVACAWLPWPVLWRAGGCLLLGLHFAFVYHLHIAASLPGAVAALAWDARRGWRICCGRGQWRKVSLCTPVFVSYRLAVARFRASGRCRHSVILLPDRVGAEDFRRLRVRLIQSVHGN